MGEAGASVLFAGCKDEASASESCAGSECWGQTLLSQREGRSCSCARRCPACQELLSRLVLCQLSPSVLTGETVQWVKGEGGWADMV